MRCYWLFIRVLRAFGWVGGGAILEVINALLGKENITNYSLGDLREEHNRAMIANKLLNYGSEIKGHLDSDEFKQLASGEPSLKM